MQCFTCIGGSSSLCIAILWPGVCGRKKMLRFLQPLFSKVKRAKCERKIRGLGERSFGRKYPPVQHYSHGVEIYPYMNYSTSIELEVYGLMPLASERQSKNELVVHVDTLDRISVLLFFIFSSFCTIMHKVHLTPGL